MIDKITVSEVFMHWQIQHKGKSYYSLVLTTGDDFKKTFLLTKKKQEKALLETLTLHVNYILTGEAVLTELRVKAYYNHRFIDTSPELVVEKESGFKKSIELDEDQNIRLLEVLTINIDTILHGEKI